MTRLTNKKCTRVSDQAFPEVKVAWRQPGDFGLYLAQDSGVKERRALTDCCVAFFIH
jgi:hypothetical protein